ncbi:MAG: hypothetical protein IH830_12700, partial [Planctomycetes bacterium]|nr:hypothetical protein [Planctomycetota bacterium]
LHHRRDRAAQGQGPAVPPPRLSVHQARRFVRHRGRARLRAGASSVAEAWANSVPTIFVPYPHHRDQHQQRNAQPMVAVGGAVIEPDHLDPTINAHHIGTTLRALLSDHDRRRTMQVNLRARPPADAAVTIARLLLDLPDDQPGSPADAHALTAGGVIPTAAG